MNPLLTVIIPVYNTATYLPECLDSICNQSYRNLEIIIIDDASTDNSLQVIKDYAGRDPRIKVIEFKENKGQGYARNRALEIATGDWVTGVDSDDYIKLDTYEDAVALIDDEVDMVCFGGEVTGKVSESEKKQKDAYFKPKYTGKQIVNANLIRNTNVYFCNKLWRRSLIDKHQIRFSEGLWYEDTFFFHCAIVFARKTSYLDKSKYFYLQRKDSTMGVTQNRSPRTLEHLVQLERILEQYRRKKIAERYANLEAFVFARLYSTTLATVPDNLVKKAKRIGDRIIRKYDLLQRYPLSGCINTAYIIPWYMRPFLKHTEKKRIYRFFGVRIYQEDFSSGKIERKVFGFRVK